MNPDEELLVVEPDTVPEQCHACINALYEELLHREGIQSKYATLLEKLGKLCSDQTTLYLDDELTDAELILIWGSPQAKYIKEIIFGSESDYYFDKDYWAENVKAFERTYRIPYPYDLFLLLGFSECVLNNIYDGQDLLLLAKFRIGEPPNIYDASEELLNYGKYSVCAPEYYPFTFEGIDLCNTAMFVDYYNKRAITAYDDFGVEFQPTAWDSLLVNINSKIDFNFCDEEDRSDKEWIIEQIDVLAGGDYYDDYDLTESLLGLTFQRIAIAYLRRNPIKECSMPVEEFELQYGSNPDLSRLPEGMFLDGPSAPRRMLPLKHCRWQDSELIEAILGTFYCLTRAYKSTEDGNDISDEVISEIARINKLLEKDGHPPLQRKKSVNDVMNVFVDLAVREADEGYPLLAYFCAFRAWRNRKAETDSISLRLFRSSLPQLGMKPLLKTVELTAEDRYGDIIQWF